METKEILSFIEDKDVKTSDDWYFHATKTDIGIIEKILDEGIKSSYLRNEKGNHFNGQYYISLYKNIEESEGIKLWLNKSPKFIIQDISPFYADRSKFKFRKLFINIRIPLRTSEWDGEFQQYLEIDPSKIIAMEYSLSHMLSISDELISKQRLLFLKEIALFLQKTNRNLHIYDLSSKREINKNKILSLNL